MYRYDAKLTEVARDLRSEGTSLPAYYERIRERLREIEPKLHAFVSESDRSARLERAVTDTIGRWERSPTLPPLYGVNVGIKDIFHVDGLPTRAGTNLPPEELAGPQASVVTTLRDAGAIIMGKTVTTEFAHSPTGPTRNPHDLDHTPGGSSSGSAAAVAAGLCPLALGTQTEGSVVRPAAFCGIVGFKPSKGRIPTDGIIPYSRSADQVGMFTQDLASMRVAASVLCTEWTPQPRHVELSTVGVPSRTYLEQATDIGLKRFEAQLDALEAAGYEIRHVPLFDDIARINERHEAMISAEAALAHARLFTEYRDRYHPETARMVSEGWETTVDEVGKGRSSQQTVRDAISAAMRDHGLDVLVSPAAPGPAPEGLDDSGDPVMNRPWTHAGVPALTIPDHDSDGLPVGLQCVTPHGQDEELLTRARELSGRLQSGSS